MPRKYFYRAPVPPTNSRLIFHRFYWEKRNFLIKKYIHFSIMLRKTIKRIRFMHFFKQFCVYIYLFIILIIQGDAKNIFFWD